MVSLLLPCTPFCSVFVVDFGQVNVNWESSLYTVDCLSVKQLSNVITDGEYRIRVFGKDNSYTQVSIYCSDMGNEVPKEYLTLLSGQANNYVDISHAETKCKLDEDSGNFVSFVICL